jgi:hypothetical protein
MTRHDIGAYIRLITEYFFSTPSSSLTVEVQLRRFDGGYAATRRDIVREFVIDHLLVPRHWRKALETRNERMWSEIINVAPRVHQLLLPHRKSPAMRALAQGNEA